MKPLAIALLLAGFALPAGDPPGFFLWKSAELKGFSKTLAPKMNDKKVATQTVASFGNYSFMVAHREGSGEAEYHATQADIFFVQSGEAFFLWKSAELKGVSKTLAPKMSDKKVATQTVANFGNYSFMVAHREAV